MANNSLGVLLIVGAIVLIGLIVFSSTIITVGTGLFAEINADIANFFSGLSGSSGSNSTTPTLSPGATPTPTPTGSGSGGSLSAVSWFAFTIHFTDGTSQNLNMNPTFSLFALSVTWNGKTVSSIDVLIRLKVTGSNLGAWSTTASQHIEIYLSPSTTPASSSTGSYPDSGGSWISGASNTILDTPISGSTLDALFGEYGTGSWVFQTTGYVTLTMNGQTYTATMGQQDVTLQNSETLSIASLTGSGFQTYQLHK